MERAISSLFSENPSATFLGDDLVLASFPGVNRVEKKHKVSAFRAAAKVAAKLHWSSKIANDTGGGLVFYNLLNLRSYAIGMTRAHELGARYEKTVTIELLPVHRHINSVQADSRVVYPDQRIDVRYAPPTEAEAFAQLTDGKKSCWVKTGGPYPLAVKAYRQEVSGSPADDLWRRFNALVYTAVYNPSQIAGEIHPDFLAA